MEVSKKLVVFDYATTEIHIYSLLEGEDPMKFLEEQHTEHGQSFKSSQITYMVVDIDATEGRLPIYIHD